MKKKLNAAIEIFQDNSFEITIFSNPENPNSLEDCKRKVELIEKELTNAQSSIRFSKEEFLSENSVVGYKLIILGSLEKNEDLRNSIIDSLDKTYINYRETPLFAFKEDLDKKDIDLARNKISSFLDKAFSIGNLQLFPIERKEGLFAVAYDFENIIGKGDFAECKKQLFKLQNTYDDIRQKEFNHPLTPDSPGYESVIYGFNYSPEYNKNTSCRDIYYEARILEVDIHLKEKLKKENPNLFISNDTLVAELNSNIITYDFLKSAANAIDDKNVNALLSLKDIGWNLNQDIVKNHISSHPNLSIEEKQSFLDFIQENKILKPEDVNMCIFSKGEYIKFPCPNDYYLLQANLKGLSQETFAIGVVFDISKDHFSVNSPAGNFSFPCYPFNSFSISSLKEFNHFNSFYENLKSDIDKSLKQNPFIAQNKIPSNELSSSSCKTKFNKDSNISM